MNFLIANTFRRALARLPGQAQKAVKTTAFDLQMDPSRPGLKLHRVDGSKDPNFWTVRVNDDLRIVIHRTDGDFLLCYVAGHDEAYAWAERRRIEAHPTTGAAQFVELVHHVVEETQGPRRAPAAPAAPISGPPGAFDLVTDGVLLSYGVPPDWIPWIRESGEDGLFDLADHLPAEAVEALLALATGGTPQPRPVAAPDSTTPFAHPDARRRFRAVADLEELRAALAFPWEQWTVFLHPSQQALVDRRFTGPARVTGSAGTGKTVVALHRAVRLARQCPNAQVFLGTFSKSLAEALRSKLGRLVDPQDPVTRQITVDHVDGVAARLYERAFGTVPTVASRAEVETVLAAAADALGATRFAARFLIAEWAQVVDPWQLRSWEAYRDVSRLGRKIRIGGKQRAALWAVFADAQARLAARGLTTWAEVMAALADHCRNRADKPFDHLVIDEAQDVSLPRLRLLAALVPEGDDRLFFAGDLGQRIFEPPYSWLGQGVDVRGRSISLTVNYRTSHQIRRTADQLLPVEIRDVDGVEDGRRGTISVFDGPEPSIRLFDRAADEIAFVGDWIAARVADGIAPAEVGVFVRSTDQLPRAEAAATASGVRWTTLDEPRDDRLVLATMHAAKGLEFRAVVVMACDEEVLPLATRIDQAGEEADLDEIYHTERHLLYVACTRARDHLAVTGVAPGSEFLEDLGA